MQYINNAHIQLLGAITEKNGNNIEHSYIWIKAII
jgi:hypothetical protein